MDLMNQYANDADARDTSPAPSVVKTDVLRAVRLTEEWYARLALRQMDALLFVHPADKKENATAKPAARHVTGKEPHKNGLKMPWH